MSEAMSREKKITLIMELIGVAERDREQARKNFEFLSDAEIDARYNLLSEGTAYIDDWRAKRPT